MRGDVVQCRRGTYSDAAGERRRQEEGRQEEGRDSRSDITDEIRKQRTDRVTGRQCDFQVRLGLSTCCPRIRVRLRIREFLVFSFCLA